jgi:S1-C subfamily serine protease
MTNNRRRPAAAIVAAVALLAASAGARGAQDAHLPPWFVQVNHRIDLDRYLEIVRADRPDIDVRAQTVRRVTNLTAGVLVDVDGHVVTRLVNYDPRVSDLELSVTANDGRKFPASLVGLDAPTGFVVLHVPGLRGTQAAPVARAPSPREADVVQIVRRDYAPAPPKATPSSRGATRRMSVLPTLPPIRGSVDPKPIPAAVARTGAVSTIRSGAFISAGDLSLVTSASGQLLGIARYDLGGVGHLVPIAFLKEVVAERILAARGSVECGWLGADGLSLDAVPAMSQARGTNGVVINRLVEGGPAARAGLAVDDVVVAFDGIPVTSLAELGALVRGTPAGSAVTLSVVRAGERTSVKAVLGTRPAAATIRLAPTSPDFGLSVLDLNPQLAEFLGVSNGVFVQFVREGTPAGRAGLRAGDVITMVGDVPVRSRAGFNSALVVAPSPEVPLSVHREKKTIVLSVSLTVPR